jgi:alanyl-tRNA synthetase
MMERTVTPTLRLYYDDAYTLRFDAQIVERTTHESRPAVILDQSYFYPESGGQPWDTGRLTTPQGSADVIETRIRDSDQAVLHVLDRELTGERVYGMINPDRRRDLTQHHSAQHILSAALSQAAAAETVSVRMSMETMTIDVNHLPLSDADLERVERLANEVVQSNRPIRCWYPDPSEIPALGLRKLPDVVGKLRVVDVSDGFDVTACGGTHVRNTGEIGLIKIIRQEKFKGGARLEFKAAGRAITDYTLKNALLNGLASDLTTAYTEIPATLAKFRDELKVLKSELKVYRDQALANEATALYTAADSVGSYRVVVAAFPERTVDDLKTLSSQLNGYADCVSLLGIAGEKSLILISRGDAVGIDAVSLLKVALGVLGVERGGGRPNSAQGGGSPATVDQVRAALNAAREHVLNSPDR